MKSKRTRPSNQGRRTRRSSRRGVASVLAMMFLILFGSLVGAMAVASTGNIRTAAMHLHVMRAQSAAETGLRIAEQRLAEAASRFVVAESEIDADFAWALWTGDDGAIGDYSVLIPPSGYAEASEPSGLAQALVNHHAADLNILEGGEFITAPVIGAAPAGTDGTEFTLDSWVLTPAVMIEGGEQDGAIPPAFQIRYAPLADGQTIRAIVDGIVFDYGRNNQPIRRTISRDFQIVKRVNHAIISPSRIMIGKNVMVEGDLGARFDDVDFNNGDPLVIRSDFFGLDPDLDAKLTDFWAGVATNDIDNDNRLRLRHPIEGAGIPSNDEDYDGDGEADGAFVDATRDGFLDEMDLFIRHYDADGDGRVTLSAALIAGTPAADATPEFVDGDGAGIDDQLAFLIDSSRPDRNRNGISGWVDANANGRYDPEDENPADFDDNLGVFSDEALGWRDGYIDRLDQYAKVRGTLSFTASASAWEASQGDIAERVRGPIDPGKGEAAMEFAVSDEDLPVITAESFTDTENDLIAAADGDPFWDQVASELGVSVAALATWTPADNPADEDEPRFLAVWDDADQDGLPDNAAEAYFEKSPFNSPNFADWYYRPVFENMRFRNVKIPMGLNGLFINCEFIGVTHVRAHRQNTHPYWTEYGKMVFDESEGYPVPAYPRAIYGDDAGETAGNAPPMLPESAVPPNQNVLLALSPLDKGDILANEIGAFSAEDYDSLPEPLVLDVDLSAGVTTTRRVTDTKLLSNNLRFHDTLFVGSIVSDTPQGYTQVRNKLQFTGATRFVDQHPTEPNSSESNPDAEDMDEIAKSSMMLPNYSVDIGSFNSPPEQDVELNGAIIAGVLDVRGNATITGALLLTFDPIHGQGPLQDVAGNPIGNPAGYNASLGYFGPDEGDFESLNPDDLTVVGGVRIVGWDLDGDGIPDLPHDETPTQAQLDAGAVAVPFYGFGRIRLSHDPNMVMPSGLLLPLQINRQPGSYKEGY